MEHHYKIGKVDYNGNGRRNCMAEITWDLQGGRFTMSARIWNPAGTDCYASGQCVDEVANFFPSNGKVQRMRAIWRAWHLNDMQAGSPAQTAWLKQHAGEFDRAKGDRFTWATQALAAAGLNPDPDYLHNGKPYRYGSAWLEIALPPEVVAEIESWAV